MEHPVITPLAITHTPTHGAARAALAIHADLTAAGYQASVDADPILAVFGPPMRVSMTGPDTWTDAEIVAVTAVVNYAIARVESAA